MIKYKIKKGDSVIVISGKDKNKISNVKKVFPKKGKVILDGLNIVKCFNKRKKMALGQGDTKAMPISISNVSHIDPISKKATRTRIIIRDNKKLLVSQKSGEIIREISKINKESENV